MEALFKVWTGYLASGVEGGAGLLIALAALQATIRTLLNYFLQKEIDRAAQRQPENALQVRTPAPPSPQGVKATAQKAGNALRQEP